MRDDFLLRCSEHGPLAPIFDSLTPLIPPKESALRRILVEPARKQDYVFEDDELVDAMLSEVKEERGALPLLAFAASRMWIQRDRETQRLTWDAYRKIDGSEGLWPNTPKPCWNESDSNNTTPFGRFFAT